MSINTAWYQVAERGHLAVKRLKIRKGKIVETVFALLYIIILPVKSLDGPRNLVTLLSRDSMKINCQSMSNWCKFSWSSNGGKL